MWGTVPDAHGRRRRARNGVACGALCCLGRVRSLAVEAGVQICKWGAWVRARTSRCQASRRCAVPGSGREESKGTLACVKHVVACNVESERGASVQRHEAPLQGAVGERVSAEHVARRGGVCGRGGRRRRRRLPTRDSSCIGASVNQGQPLVATSRPRCDCAEAFQTCGIRCVHLRAVRAGRWRRIIPACLSNVCFPLRRCAQGRVRTSRG
jgi:hypothetical protein